MGCLLGFGILGILGRPTERTFDDYGLEAGTSVYRAEVNGKPVNASGDCDSIERMHEGWQDRGSPRFALLLGNSQLHAINQFKKGVDLTAPDLLFAARERLGKEVLTITLPNATMSEFLVLFEYVVPRQRPDALVMAACFDDTREDPLRSSVGKLLADPGTAEAVGRTPAGTRLLETIHAHDPARNPNQGAESEDTAGLTDTVQQRVEASLNAWLSAWMPLWRERPTMRGRVATRTYQLRNRVLGITAQSKRRVIPLQYAQHLESLDALLARCQEERIPAIVYIPPLRYDLETPYIAEQYEAFKRDVEAVCTRHSGAFHNLERLVPAEFWGSQQSTSGQGMEIDYMHFQGPGHVLLAEALEDLIATTDRSGD